MKKVLFVDDDAMSHQLVGAILHVLGGIEVDSCYNGREALERARLNPPDLIIAGADMPDLDGPTLTRLVRSTPAIEDTPILLISSECDARGKYLGFLQGADDYLAQPYDAMELQFRIKALLRRTGRGSTPMPLQAGPVELVPQRFAAKVGGVEVGLTGSEFAILRQLVLRADEVVGVPDLLVQALDYPPGLGNPQVIHTHVKNMRAKLREAGVSTDFLTSSRRGYTLHARG